VSRRPPWGPSEAAPASAVGGESLSAEQPLKKAGSAKKKIDKALMGFMSNLAFKVWRS
jgi:hypothetical protein